MFITFCTRSMGKIVGGGHGVHEWSELYRIFSPQHFRSELLQDHIETTTISDFRRLRCHRISLRVPRTKPLYLPTTQNGTNSPNPIHIPPPPPRTPLHPPNNTHPTPKALFAFKTPTTHTLHTLPITHQQQHTISTSTSGAIHTIRAGATHTFDVAGAV